MTPKTIKFGGFQLRAGLLTGILLFILTLSSLPEQAYAQAAWPPFSYRMTPSYQEGKIIYNIRFSKQVEEGLTDVTIKIPLPEGTRFLEADAGSSTSANFDGKEVTFFTSVVHRSIRQAFVVEVIDPTVTIYTTHAWISWKGDLPGDYLTDDESIDITLQPLNWKAPPRSRLQLQASATVTNTDIIYAIYPKNVSNRRMWDLKITMRIPEGTQFLSAEASPPFVADFDGQDVSFSIIELARQAEVAPLRFRVSINQAQTSFLVTHAWATWKNVGRGVGQSINVEDEVRTADIVVQPQAPQLVVSDMAGDVPFGNYDLTSIALQEVLQGDEAALKIIFYTAQTLTDEPLEFTLWLDSDCRLDTGQSRRGIGADYRVVYTHKAGRARIDFRDEAEGRWRRKTNLNSLVGGKMITTWVPYDLIDNSKQICWVVQARNTTKEFNPNPPSDWLPHWQDLASGQYETVGTSAVNQLDASPSFYGIEGANSDEVAALGIQVNHSDDDAEENISTGQANLDSSDLELAIDGDSQQMVGIRFQNVSIPQGAFISNAYIEFETDEKRGSATQLTLYGQIADSAPSFMSCDSGCYDLSNRPKTTALVTWDNVPAWDKYNEKHHTPNLASIVQEIVDRDGWASGNSLVFLITGSGTRTAESYDGESKAAPLLHVEYATN